MNTAESPGEKLSVLKYTWFLNLITCGTLSAHSAFSLANGALIQHRLVRVQHDAAFRKVSVS